MRPLQDEAFRVRSKTDYAELKLASKHLGNLIQVAVQLRAMMTGRKERGAACHNGGKAVGN